jgi:hypothetical protein
LGLGLGCFPSFLGWLCKRPSEEEEEEEEEEEDG